jgi:hypothetical protein
MHTVRLGASIAVTSPATEYTIAPAATTTAIPVMGCQYIFLHLPISPAIVRGVTDEDEEKERRQSLLHARSTKKASNNQDIFDERYKRSGV